MDGEITRLALATAIGATLLVLASLVAAGGSRTLARIRGAGLLGAFLALFVGIAVESLARPLIEARPYTLGFLPTTVLRAQGLAEDPDLRTRYSVDPRLRYIPTGGPPVVDLETRYAPALAGVRGVEIPAVVHSAPSPRRRGVAAMGDEEFGREIDGLYERAWAVLRNAKRDEAFANAVERTEFLGAASVGLIGLGLIGLIGGGLSLVAKALGTAWDGVRLARMTRGSAYRDVRGTALRQGGRALLHWHFRDVRAATSLATLGLLTCLASVVLGLLREEETRSLAHAVFREARDVRIARP